ncbi:STM4015 family protein [Gynuella sp.]|uniref:STM4015 family protein n=1 Tax=Gynuella sp. TaxID=2969146 RepID=UPI003D0CA377
MTISAHIQSFHQLPVQEFESGQINPATAIRLSIDWEAYEAGEKMINKLTELTRLPQCSDIKALVIGEWEGCAEGNSIQGVIDFICTHPHHFASLEALFVGEMTYEECEISWIEQGDYSAIWSALPNLKHLQIRGAAPTLGDIRSDVLTTLILESGGLAKATLASVLDAKIPMLQHLELWLGDENYGWDSNVTDLQPILMKGRFPKLQYLGLRDSDDGDALAKMLAESEQTASLQTLDLSLGTVGDEGAKALLSSPYIQSMQKLDLHFHYISADTCNQLSQLPIVVDLTDPQQEDDGDRYVAVSE